MSVSLWCEEDSGRDRTHQASVRAPWDPSASGQRVIQRLLQSEERYLPSPLYISLVQREPHRREELAKWTMELFKGLIDALLKDALCSIDHLDFFLKLSFYRVTDQLLPTTTFPQVQALGGHFKRQNCRCKGPFRLLFGLNVVK